MKFSIQLWCGWDLKYEKGRFSFGRQGHNCASLWVAHIALWELESDRE